ncbi:MAG: response regulator, partial [Bacteroidota bacterium]
MAKYNILYVDDEESNLQGFKSIYFTEYNVITAISGKEALTILEQQEIHLIITDQKMPEMTGVEFLSQVVLKYPDPIRIILTGYSDIEVIIQAVNDIGIYRYITKPWEVTEMNMILTQGIETYMLRQENKRLVLDLKKSNENLEIKVKERTEQVLLQKDEIELKNEKITSSINYAKRIQDAMLPKLDFIKQHVEDAFVLFKPRDIVSGDFYWIAE